LVSAAERQRLVVDWNATGSAYPRELCVHELFAAQAARTPDAIALTCEGEELSYGELDRRTSQLAHYLRTRGVGPEIVVGLCVERSVEMVVGLLGILKAGGAYLPLDPDYPADRLAYMLTDARVGLLLTQDALAGHLAGMAVQQDLELVRLDGEWATIATYPDSAPVNPARPDNLAYVIYTSGSTGKPKG
ncbi:AMP-binding protein, partial [Rhizobium leguminosarum]|uniref:AMP-binding protein n=1 Tax=Rhizobium leguminosarum TaxID=384 RepID=UPI003F95AA16